MKRAICLLLYLVQSNMAKTIQENLKNTETVQSGFCLSENKVANIFVKS